jgi:hypothetical protein
VSGQPGWRWCYRCQGMWYGGGSSSGGCPAGGWHSGAGSIDYVLGYGSPPYGNQDLWRWCFRCYGLYYSGNGYGGCPAGGGHGNSGSVNYFLAF